MRFLDLFSGIGGFSLGLERAGHETKAFCEIDAFCRRVLKKHWPDVPCYEDIRTLTADRLRTDGIAVDAICGGFPCQDISVAGKGAGIEGERSGLWSEYRRLIGELRPGYIIVENVAALLGRGLDRVLGDLAAIGYDAEWHCIPASAIGAPHRRDRVWIIAYASGKRVFEFSRSGDIQNGERDNKETQSERNNIKARTEAIRNNGTMANTESKRRGKTRRDSERSKKWPSGSSLEGQRIASRIQAERSSFSGSSWWTVEPNVGRVAHGVPSRVDRLRSLGNAVVPQIPEIIGRALRGGKCVRP